MTSSLMTAWRINAPMAPPVGRVIASTRVTVQPDSQVNYIDANKYVKQKNEVHLPT